MLISIIAPSQSTVALNPMKKGLKNPKIIIGLMSREWENQSFITKKEPNTLYQNNRKK